MPCNDGGEGDAGKMQMNCKSYNENNQCRRVELYTERKPGGITAREAMSSAARCRLAGGWVVD